MKMNLPNKLTVLRLILVPAILVVMLLPYSILNNVIALVIFSGASITDYFDGKIARKYNLITDFGKFLDPLADKFMVIAAIFGIVCRSYVAQDDWMFWIFMGMLIVTIFRELAVASIRLIASTKANVVVAANMLGKVKTVTQIACIILALVEPVAHDLVGRAVPDFFFSGFYALTYLTAAVAIIFTVWSGINYIAGCWKYLDPEK
ncbi:MAG: CDP-diacylglycerol--glycerol-3-phosphate 3-phosphatidyltransferase [Clostridia bacterium]|nr:CDP-diacylglycerol--glycerol-3-phosphate 3-phosphatidyltransferase [Clostridia bacterium]